MAKLPSGGLTLDCFVEEVAFSLESLNTQNHLIFLGVRLGFMQGLHTSLGILPSPLLPHNRKLTHAQFLGLWPTPSLSLSAIFSPPKYVGAALGKRRY